MPKKSKTSLSGGGGRTNGVEKKKPRKKSCRPVDKAGAVTDLGSVIDAIPLYFTVRKPRSIAMVIETRKAIVQCLEPEPNSESASVTPNLNQEMNDSTQHHDQGLGLGFEFGLGLETPPNNVKIEEEDEGTNSNTTTTTSTTTTPTSTLDSIQWLEAEEVLPGPIPDLYQLYWDDKTLPMDFLEDLPYCC